MLIMLVLCYQKLKYRNTNLCRVKINQGSKRAFYTWHWNKYKEVCHNLTKINEGEPKSYRIFKMFMLVIAEIWYLLGTGQPAYCGGSEEIVEIDVFPMSRIDANMDEFDKKVKDNLPDALVDDINKVIFNTKDIHVDAAAALHQVYPEYTFNFLLRLIDMRGKFIQEDTIRHKIYIDFNKQTVSFDFNDENRHVAKADLIYQLNEAYAIARLKNEKFDPLDALSLKINNRDSIDEALYNLWTENITSLRIKIYNWNSTTNVVNPEGLLNIDFTSSSMQGEQPIQMEESIINNYNIRFHNNVYKVRLPAVEYTIGQCADRFIKDLQAKYVPENIIDAIITGDVAAEDYQLPYVVIRQLHTRYSLFLNLDQSKNEPLTIEMPQLDVVVDPEYIKLFNKCFPASKQLLEAQLTDNTYNLKLKPIQMDLFLMMSMTIDEMLEYDRDKKYILTDDVRCMYRDIMINHIFLANSCVLQYMNDPNMDSFVNELKARFEDKDTIQLLSAVRTFGRQIKEMDLEYVACNRDYWIEHRGGDVRELHRLLWDGWSIHQKNPKGVYYDGPNKITNKEKANGNGLDLSKALNVTKTQEQLREELKDSSNADNKGKDLSEIGEYAVDRNRIKTDKLANTSYVNNANENVNNASVLSKLWAGIRTGSFKKQNIDTRLFADVISKEIKEQTPLPTFSSSHPVQIDFRLYKNPSIDEYELGKQEWLKACDEIDKHEQVNKRKGLSKAERYYPNYPTYCLQHRQNFIKTEAQQRATSLNKHAVGTEELFKKDE